jgi:hypothetical protein
VFCSVRGGACRPRRHRALAPRELTALPFLSMILAVREISAVEAMKLGNVEKPFEDDRLIEMIDLMRRIGSAQRSDCAGYRGIASLSPHGRQVMDGLVIGHVLLKPRVADSLATHIWDAIGSGRQANPRDQLRDST